MSTDSPQHVANRSPQAEPVGAPDSSHEESTSPAVAGIRRFNRVDLDIDVILQDDEGWEYPVEAVDISPTGVYVASDFLFDEGTEHDIMFRAPSGEVLFRLAGRVVRVVEGADEGRASDETAHDNPPGMAYEFHRASAETRRRLKSALGLKHDSAQRVRSR